VQQLCALIVECVVYRDAGLSDVFEAGTFDVTVQYSQVRGPSGGCKEMKYRFGVQLDLPLLDSRKEHVMVPGMREKLMQRPV